MLLQDAKDAKFAEEGILVDIMSRQEKRKRRQLQGLLLAELYLLVQRPLLVNGNVPLEPLDRLPFYALLLAAAYAVGEGAPRARGLPAARVRCIQVPARTDKSHSLCKLSSTSLLDLWQTYRPFVDFLLVPGNHSSEQNVCVGCFSIDM